MVRNFVIVFLLLLLGAGRAFSEGFSDSLLLSKPQKARFVFNFDTRYTFFENDRVRVVGLKSGVEWHNKLRTGLGYYFVRTPIITRFPQVTSGQTASEARVKFAYGAVYGEYVLLKNIRWEVSLPLQTGFGKLHTEHRNFDGQVLKTESKPLWLVEPSVSGHYKVFNWAGIGAGVGYRQMLGQVRRETSQLSAPIYFVKVKLFVGDLYRQLRNCAPSAEM